MDIPKGLLVQIPVYAIHHDPKIWPEPEKFNPYRFSHEEKAKHNLSDWMPFGAGPRMCIAMRLAILETKIAVAYLLRKYKFVRSVETEVCGLKQAVKISVRRYFLLDYIPVVGVLNATIEKEIEQNFRQIAQEPHAILMCFYFFKIRIHLVPFYDVSFVIRFFWLI